MRIAMVSEHASPLAALGGADAGGQNVHVAALSEALARRGHEVTVFTRRDQVALPDRVPLAPGVTVEHVPAGPPMAVPKDELLPYMGAFGEHLAARWGADPPDVVHAHFWMSGLAALVARREVPVPVVQTFHALGVVKRRHQRDRDTSPPSRLRLERAIARDVDRVVATCSDEVFELLRLGVPRSGVTVVPSGVDLDRFTPEPAPGDAAGDGSLPAAGVPPRGQQHRLLYLGRLVERKGVDDLLWALRLVPGAEVLVAGGPAAADLDADPDVRRLRATAAAAGVSGRVHLLGRVARPHVPALLRSADLVVTVPWYEPFGIVPLEAMACGVPVVGAAVGGIVDTVVDGATGVLVPPRRPDVLAHCLRSLLADPLRLSGYGLAGVDRARARYGWPRVAADTESVYDDLLAARGVAGGLAQGVGR